MLGLICSSLRTTHDDEVEMSLLIDHLRVVIILSLCFVLELSIAFGGGVRDSRNVTFATRNISESPDIIHH